MQAIAFINTNSLLFYYCIYSQVEFELINRNIFILIRNLKYANFAKWI
jgi:hypothetical protein